MSTGQAILIMLGFVAAVFAIGMGCGQIAEWWRGRKERKCKN